MTRTNSPSSLDTLFLQNLFAAVDSRDADKVAPFVTDDVAFRFGSAEPTRGKASLIEASREFSASIAGISHTIIRSWGPEPGVAVVELQVTYRRHDGSEVTLPCCNIFRMRDGLVDDYRVYMDVTPVFSS